MADEQAAYGSFSKLGCDGYTLLSSKAIDEAESFEQSETYAKLFGSTGKCVVKDFDKDKTVNYASPHVGISNPEYDYTIGEITTKPDDTGRHGLAKLCGWDDDTVNKIKANHAKSLAEQEERLRKYDVGSSEYKENKAKYDILKRDYEEQEQIIEGGYNIDANTDYAKLEDHLEAIETDYKEAVPNEDDRIGHEVQNGWNDKTKYEPQDEPQDESQDGEH